MQDTRQFTLNMANVELIAEDKGSFSLRNNVDITISGPLVLDADPFKVSQCEITGGDAATYLELRLMPGYLAHLLGTSPLVSLCQSTGAAGFFRLHGMTG